MLISETGAIDTETDSIKFLPSTCKPPSRPSEFQKVVYVWKSVIIVDVSVMEETNAVIRTSVVSRKRTMRCVHRPSPFRRRCVPPTELVAITVGRRVGRRTKRPPVCNRVSSGPTLPPGRRSRRSRGPLLSLPCPSAVYRPRASRCAPISYSARGPARCVRATSRSSQFGVTAIALLLFRRCVIDTPHALALRQPVIALVYPPVANHSSARGMRLTAIKRTSAIDRST